VKLYDYYQIVKNNIILKDNKKVDYSKLMEYIKLRSLIHHFNTDNFKKKCVQLTNKLKIFFLLYNNAI
jgi:hypothetical protein